MKKLLIMALSLLNMGGAAWAQNTVKAHDPNAKTFPPSEQVTTQQVRYYNRLGIQIVGDLYIPKELDPSLRHPAIVVGHPFGGVKEQSSGLYAQTLAERGFVTLAFDASYAGESGGQPRYMISPEAYVEDFSAAVDFLGTRPFVDRERIGVIGICGSGGFALSAAGIDPRMKAVATVSMYDMGRANRQGLGDTMTEEELRQQLVEIGEQRYAEFLGEDMKYNVGTPWEIDDSTPQAGKEFFDYYRTPRGQHARSTTAMSYVGSGAFINFYPFQHIRWISPRPLLFIAGENANSRYFSEDAYRLAGEPKRLLIVPGAGHVDLYDRSRYIPFDELASFFNDNLK